MEQIRFVRCMAFCHRARMRRRLALLLAAAALASHASAQQEDRIDTRAQLVESMKKEPSKAVSLSSSDFVAATPQQVWQVLTDYPHHADFIPNLLSTKVLSRSGGEALLEQHGRAGFLFFKRDIRMIVRATEKPMSAIDIELVSGDMKHYDAHWHISAFEKDGIAGTRIDYAASMEPDFFVPRLLSKRLVQGDVKLMTQALLAEIIRRATK